jgi:hypothetical protein
MAAFRQHLTISSLLGAGYTAGTLSAGVEWTHAVLAGAGCAIAGMLPDLDSASGRPARELFGVTAVAAPLLLLHRMHHAGLTPEGMILFAGALYIAIRFGFAWVFRHLTVHRGMFHSVPAALISAELAYLAHDCPEPHGRLILAGGVLLGFLSHLVLDELSSVDARGLTVRLNKAAGSALKLASRSPLATATAWLILLGLTYLIVAEQGVLTPDHGHHPHVSLGGARP